MSAPVNVEDLNSGSTARVTVNGELVVGTLDYSAPYYVELGVDDQVYNAVPAIVGKRFVIVGLLVGADRNVTTDCSVHIYESLSADGTSDKDILKIDLNKGEHTYLNLINMATQTTRWINATTDDDDVDLTVFGYYVDA